jgi:cysteine synthase A
MPLRHTPAAQDLPGAARPGRLFDSILDTIGHTPLVRLPRLEAARGGKARLALKLEFFNPLASLKDRIGQAMVADAEAAGLLTPGAEPPQTIVEPTSGNTGIALAFVAAAKGYRLVVTMPDGASSERRRMLRLLGAEVVLTPAAQGMSGAIAEAERIAAATPGAWMPRQFDNPANPAIHATTTAEEIWADTAGQVDVVVAGLGTGGTLTGIATTLKPRRPGLRLVGVEPAESAFLSGDDPGPHEIQGIGAGFKPGVLELEKIDLLRRVTEREAFAAARLCARTDGIPIGISSGAVLHAMLELAEQPEHHGQLIIGIAASFAERYLSTDLFHGL